MAAEPPPSTLFIVIASNLTVFTYNIGVLIYSLPIPSRRLKKWAPMLIEDSIYTALMILLFTTALYASDYVAAFSGTTLTDIASWLKDNAHHFAVEYLVRRLASIPIRLIPVGGGVISSLVILPVSLIFYTVMTATATLLVPIYILVKLRSFIAALGVALYAIPFRIGRNIGASLIAFALVGYVAFHYVPQWVSLIQGTVEGGYNGTLPANVTVDVPGLRQVEQFYVWGVVVDRFSGKPVYGVLVFKNIDENVTTTYMVQRDGAYYSIDSGVPLARGRYNVTLEYLGLKLNPVRPLTRLPEDLKLTYEYSDMPYRLDLLFHNVIFLPPQAVFVSSCYVQKYNINIIDKYVYNITFLCDSPPYTTQGAVLAVPETYHIKSIKVTNLSSSLTITRYYIPWRGVPARQVALAYVTYTSPYYISVEYTASNKYYKPIINKNNSNINRFSISIDSIISIIDFITPTVIHGVAYAVAAFSFVTIVSSLILGFARFIGARAPRLVFEP